MSARFGNAALPGFTFGKTYAPSPVWKGSATTPPRFVPLGANRQESRKRCARLYHQLRRFERQTRTRERRQDGKVGRNGLRIMEAFLFDFMNHRSGALYPSYAAIARAANMSVRSVARGLQALKCAGVLSWQRQCSGSVEGGRYVLRQEPNAYAVLQPTAWRGFRDDVPPAPEPGTTGEHPPMPEGAGAFKDVRAAGGSVLAADAAMRATAAPGSWDEAAARLAELRRRNAAD